MTERPLTLRRRAYVNRATFWLAAIFGVIAVATLLWAAWYRYEVWRLDTEGVEVAGVVTDRHMTTRRTRGGTSHSYYVTVRYDDEGGGHHLEEFQVTAHFFDNAWRNAPVTVRYVPASPGITEVEQGYNAGMAGTWGIVGALAAAAAIFCWGLFQRALDGMRRALTQGETRSAEVIERKSAGRRGGASVRISWRDGTGAIGRSFPGLDKELPRLHEQITVYIDPRSGRGYWEGDL